MSSYREAQASELNQIEKLFKAVRDAVADPALFNWPDELMAPEIKLSSFYISEGYDKNLEAFIGYRAQGDGVEILALGTHPDFCGRGVMKKLLTQFVQKYSRHGVHIYLEVHAKNQKALSLYQQIGFKTLRVRKSYYQDGGDALVMHFEC